MDHVGLADLPSHLHAVQYADDIAIFSIATLRQLNMIKLILYIFELLTGLKTNFSKTLVVGIGLKQEEVQGVAIILGRRISQFPITYLGITLHTRSIPSSYWNFIVNKVANNYLDGEGTHSPSQEHFCELSAENNTGILDVNPSLTPQSNQKNR